MARRYNTQPPTIQGVLATTRPREPLSIASAEMRLAEILAQVAEIGRQIEDKSRERGPAWRKTAMQARDELRKEEHSLNGFIDQKKAPVARAERARKAASDLTRQDVDRSTRDARRLSKKEQKQQLWDLYMKSEVALLSILAGGGFIGPLGDSILYTAQNIVPEWYRDHWLHTVYGTTWGRQAEALRSEHDNENHE